MRLLIFFLLLSVASYGQILIDPSASPTTSRINDGISDAYVATGTDAYTVTAVGTFNYTYLNGHAVSITFTNPNTGAATLDFDGLGVKDIEKWSGGSLVDVEAGDLIGTVRIRYDGTRWVMESGGSGGGSGGWSTNGTTTLLGDVDIEGAGFDLEIGTSASPLNSLSLYQSALGIGTGTVSDLDITALNGVNWTGQALTFENSKLKLMNAADTYSSTFSSAITANRTHTMPDFTGALLGSGGSNTLSGNTDIVGTSRLRFGGFGAFLNGYEVYSDANIVLSGGTSSTVKYTLNPGVSHTFDGSFILDDLSTGGANEILTVDATGGVSSGSFTSDALGSSVSDPARTVTGTDAIVQADNGRTVYFNSATPFDFTIDDLTINSQVMFINIGSADVDLINGSGVTMEDPTGASISPFTVAAGSSAAITYFTTTEPIVLASGGGGGSGTVTSVGQSFTGGLISVGGSPVTTSGTLALTVAGTSGGIPYFSSSSAWASSSALTANALMIGGGAGAAPSTTTTGTGVLTWLGTPSWTNFNSAITGTAPYVPLAGATYGTTTGNGLDITSSTVTSGNLVSITNTGTAAASNTKTGLFVGTSGANGTSSQTTYAARFSNTNTGTTSTNIAGHFTATGGTTNYGVYSIGNIYAQNTGAGASMIVNRTDGKSANLIAGASGGAFLFDNSGTFSIVAATSANVLAGVGTGTTIFSGTSTQFNIPGSIPLFIGTGTITANTKLDVLGLGTTTGYSARFANSSNTARLAVRDNGAIEFSGSAGTAGQVPISAGGSAPPVWTTPTGQDQNVQANVTRYSMSLGGFSSGNSGSLGTPVTSSQIADGESVTIVVHWSAKDLDSNTGAGGIFITTWTKDSGTLNKVSDLNTGLSSSDTGDTLTVTSADSSGNIVLTLGTGTIAGNMKASGFAEITINK